MVSRAVKTCLKLVEKMVNLHRNVLKDGFINQISRHELENLIAFHIGADQRTIEKYVGVCVTLELLKPHIYAKGKVSVYSINIPMTEKYVREVFGRNLRQLQLLE